VVKCDGVTQTEEGSSNRCSRNTDDGMFGMSEHNYGAPQWDHTPPAAFDHDPFGRDYSAYTSNFEAELPDDLASLQIEGDLHCDIDEVLGADLEQLPKSSWVFWNTPFDKSSFGDGVEPSSFMNVGSGIAHSSFYSGQMDVCGEP